MTHDTPATILVAEDDATTRTFLADELSADGYELLVAESARDALRLLGTKFPDLVILDVGLPDGSGLDVVRRVCPAGGAADRTDRGTPPPPPRARPPTPPPASPATRRCASSPAAAVRSTACAPSSTGQTTSSPSPSP